uniref:Uncharacterized protein n=1 Tax=Grammatophora oceanica TaxID=210454 RepID=A0A7S1VPE7_9STRA|mmetsp:Transcript_52338/g.78207  ORF Transcript_52338/g.78207 Transcript_52338/m.78207 type:complete len:146 (+) Transcript_52338:287-724(+)
MSIIFDSSRDILATIQFEHSATWAPKRSKRSFRESITRNLHPREQLINSKSPETIAADQKRPVNDGAPTAAQVVEFEVEEVDAVKANGFEDAVKIYDADVLENKEGEEVKEGCVDLPATAAVLLMRLWLPATRVGPRESPSSKVW